MTDAQFATSATVEDSNGESYHYLELLARVKKALDSAVDIAVPFDHIRPYEDQPRKHFNEESVQRLASSIDAGGQATSGMVRARPGKTKYELVDGERRWRALQLIPESRRPMYKAKLIEADDEVVQFLIGGIANFNRDGHTPLEVADTIERLSGFGLPMKEIASLLGFSEFWAYQMFGLKKLEPNVRALLDPTRPRQQQLPVSAAIQISKIEPKLQLALAERVLNKDLTLGRLRSEVIRTAKKHGSTIRLREVSPLKQWESLGNKIEVAARMLGDAESMLKGGALNRFARVNADIVNRMLKQLNKAAKDIQVCEQNLRNSQIR